jgi:hypothetical protein
VQDEAVDDAEDRGVAADAESQRQNRDRGKPRPPQQLAARVTKILTERIHVRVPLGLASGVRRTFRRCAAIANHGGEEIAAVWTRAGRRQARPGSVAPGVQRRSPTGISAPCGVQVGAEPEQQDAPEPVMPGRAPEAGMRLRVIDEPREMLQLGAEHGPAVGVRR